MCSHHWLIEHRPDRTDPSTWTTLDRVDMSGGRGISPDEIQRGRDQALRVAGVHATADPSRAVDIVICRSDCSGETYHDERPFQDTLPAPDPQWLAEQLITARQGLGHYARPGLWSSVTREHDGEVTLTCAALSDRGQVARRTLRSL